MRIYNRESDKTFDNIEIFFTPEEAAEVMNKLKWLIDHPSDIDADIDSDEVDGVYQKELTVSVYTKENLKYFDSRSRKVIEEDK
ncbi:MAG: hypothetical protein ABIY50_11690 [Ignavibacteria bacterium]